MRFFYYITFVFTFGAMLTGCLPAAKHEGDIEPVTSIDTNDQKASLGMVSYENKCARCHRDIESSTKPLRSSKQISDAIRFVSTMNAIELSNEEMDAIVWVLAGNRPKRRPNPEPEPQPTPPPTTGGTGSTTGGTGSTTGGTGSTTGGTGSTTGGTGSTTGGTGSTTGGTGSTTGGTGSTTGGTGSTTGGTGSTTGGTGSTTGGSVPQLSSTELARLGVDTYEARCVSCHSALDSTTKPNRSAAQITSALTSVGVMGSIDLSETEVQAIAWVLAGNRPPAPTACDNELSAQPAEIKRLTKQQAQNSIRDLFSMFTGWEGNTIVRHYENILPDDFGEYDRLDGTINVYTVRGFFLAAQEVKEFITASTYRINLVVSTHINNSSGSCASFSMNNPSEQCITQFIQNFGLKAHRRPLSNEELVAYRQTYDNYSTPIESFSNTILRFLVAPRFVFKIYSQDLLEVGGAQEIHKLDSYDIISKITMRLWDRGPDDHLYNLAANNDLSTDANFNTALNYALSQKSKVDSSLSRFTRQWLGITDVTDIKMIASHTSTYVALRNEIGFTSPLDPNTNQPIRNHVLQGQLQHEFANEVDELVNFHYYQDDSFSTLFTTDISFTRYPPAMSIYGLNTPAPAQESMTHQNAVRMPANTRAGLVTRAALITDSHISPNPVHRAIKIREKFLCLEVPPPPPDLPGEDLVAPAPVAHLTTREQYAQKTSSPACLSCHSQINPFGFVMGKYNSFGAFFDTEIVTYDGDQPETRLTVNDSVDFSEAWPQAGVINGPVELSQQIGQSSEARSCFSKKYLSYMNSRLATTSTNQCNLDRMSEHLQTTTFKQSLHSIFKAKSFRYRRVD